MENVFKFYTPCAPLQFGVVGSTSDVCGFYVFVLVTNIGILNRNNVNFAYTAYITAI